MVLRIIEETKSKETLILVTRSHCSMSQESCQLLGNGLTKVQHQ
jgi:hypothetical protein